MNKPRTATYRIADRRKELQFRELPRNGLGWSGRGPGKSHPGAGDTMLNEDYRDMGHALVDERVRFLLAGADALVAHGYPCATIDIDIWIMPSRENADAGLRA